MLFLQLNGDLLTGSMRISPMFHIEHVPSPYSSSRSRSNRGWGLPYTIKNRNCFNALRNEHLDRSEENEMEHMHILVAMYFRFPETILQHSMRYPSILLQKAFPPKVRSSSNAKLRFILQWWSFHKPTIPLE